MFFSYFILFPRLSFFSSNFLLSAVENKSPLLRFSALYGKSKLCARRKKIPSDLFYSESALLQASCVSILCFFTILAVLLFCCFPFSLSTDVLPQSNMCLVPFPRASLQTFPYFDKLK